MSVKAIEIKSRLATTPAKDPQYALKVQLKNGEFLQVADPRATRAMVALMDTEAMLGGAASHYGGPAAFAELMSAVHGLMFYQSKMKKKEWHEIFHFVNDAGHCENGLYALKANYQFSGLSLNDLKKFRSIESKLTGHGEAHLFAEGVLVSNGPLGSGLPQAQGLAVGDALNFNKRMTICALSDGGAMEGEAREAFAAIPGLAKKGKLAPFICIVSDNRTKLSGRIDQDAFSMEPTFEALEKMGWRVLRLQDGHSLQASVSILEEAFEQVLQDPSMPVVIHARTIKGKGNKKAEASATGAHGFPLKKAEELPAFLAEIYEGTSVPAELMAWCEEVMQKEKDKAAKKAAAVGGAEKVPEKPTEKIQAGISAAMINARKSGLPVFSVSADLQGSTGVADFHKACPEAALDVGVAESNMISTAIGLSLSGYIPVVDTFAQFGVTKGALPILMSNLSQGPVIGVFSHIGFQDAADGASHQALSYLAQVGSIPHVEAYSLSSSSEAEALMTQAIEDYASARKSGRVPPTRLFFLGRENFPKSYLPEAGQYKLGEAQVVHDSSAQHKRSVALVAGGSLVGEALKAAAMLEAKGIGAVVVHPSCLNKVDVKTLRAVLAKTAGAIVTVEEHRVVGGMGALLAHALAVNGVKFQISSLGVGDHFGQSAYSALDLYRKHKLDAVAIEAAAQSLL